MITTTLKSTELCPRGDAPSFIISSNIFVFSIEIFLQSVPIDLHNSLVFLQLYAVWFQPITSSVPYQKTYQWYMYVLQAHGTEVKMGLKLRRDWSLVHLSSIFSSIIIVNYNCGIIEIHFQLQSGASVHATHCHLYLLVMSTNAGNTNWGWHSSVFLHLSYRHKRGT